MQLYRVKFCNGKRHLIVILEKCGENENGVKVQSVRSEVRWRGMEIMPTHL